MEFEIVIRKRESTRKFSNKKVEREKLDKILEAGRLAPTAKNIQPFKIFVVESEDGLSKIDKASPCRYNAKTVLLVCGNKQDAFKKDKFNSYEMDATIVTTHMMLEATNLGVDNIWIELFDTNILKKEFKLSDDLIPVCLLPLGYKDETCPKSPKHAIRKNMDEIVEYI